MDQFHLVFNPGGNFHYPWYYEPWIKLVQLHTNLNCQIHHRSESLFHIFNLRTSLISSRVNPLLITLDTFSSHLNRSSIFYLIIINFSCDLLSNSGKYINKGENYWETCRQIYYFKIIVKRRFWFPSNNLNFILFLFWKKARHMKFCNWYMM